ncbi:MAG TPA: TolC family protein [Acidobacteriota bacterium]|nr:TolC family protein [Acidobacteriota bacterium]
MRLNKRPFLMLTLASILGAAAMQAGQDAEPERMRRLTENRQLTLRDILDATFESNPQRHLLRALDGEVRAHELHAGGLLPDIPALSLHHQSDAIGNRRGEYELEAELELPVWLPGQRAARKALARAIDGNLDAGRDALMLYLAGELRESIWEIRMLTDELELAEFRLQTAEHLQNDVTRRFQAGELAQTDVMLAQNETLSAQTQVVRAAAVLQHAEQAYTVLTGLSEVPARPEESSAENLTVATDHPLLREADSRLAIARGERVLAGVERRGNPQILISARNVRGPFDDLNNNSFGLTFRIPLSTRSGTALSLAAAESGIARGVAELEQVRRVVATALNEAGVNLETTRRELEILRRQNAIARENRRLMQKAFDLGEADLVDLMRVQAISYEAERALRSKTIQLQWNIARHNQAAGVLP